MRIHWAIYTESTEIIKRTRYSPSGKERAVVAGRTQHSRVAKFGYVSVEEHFLNSILTFVKYFVKTTTDERYEN